MKILVRNHMFYVYDAQGKEKACFKSFIRLTEYIIITEKIGD